MPAVSKQQRKFMGLVHAVQKGEVPASKVSKSARDAAKQMKKKDVEDFASTDEKGLPKKKQNEAKWRVMYDIIKSNDTILASAVVNAKDAKEAAKVVKSMYGGGKSKIKKVVKEDRDYKDEYKKFQSSDKAKKYRAELNKYNRQKGTYGNGDGKDASHKGGKIAGFEKESINRGRAEKSRLKKEDVMPDLESFIDEVIDEIFEEHTINEGKNQMKQIYVDLDKKFKKYDYTKISDFNKVDKYLKTKFSKDSSLPDTIASFYHDYRGGEDMNKNIARLVKYAKKMKGYKKEGLRETLLRETPAASAAAAMAAIQVQNAQGKKIKGTSALQSSDPRVQKKAKGIFKRLKDKFAKGKGKRDFEKQKKAIAKGADDYIRKLDKESVNEINFSKISTAELVRQYKQMADERLFGAGALTFRLIAKELIKRKARLESVNEKVVKVSKKDDVPGNPMKMSGEEKIKKLAWSASQGTGKPGSYEIKGNKLNVNNVRPRDKGFFVRHFTMKTGFRKANLYYDGVHWQGDKKF